MAQNQKMEPRTIINISSENVTLELDGLEFRLKPYETTKTHANYALPRLLQKGRDPVASVVDLLTNGKVVDTEDRRARAAMAILKNRGEA